MPMLIYYNEIPLDEGFSILAKPKVDRLVKGRNVAAPTGRELYQKLYEDRAEMVCWHCGIKATCWVVNKGQNDIVSKPVLDLFATTRGRYVLMTRDHIIPRSLGGANDVRNLRVGCTDCNSARGNEMDEADSQFMKDHPELIRPDFVPNENTVIAKSVPTVVSKESARLARKRKRLADEREQFINRVVPSHV